MKRLALSVFVICAFATTSLAQAQVTRIEFKRVESPTFEGRVLGDVGQYEKLVGIAFGEVDPTDPRNALITDIDFAPRNEPRPGRVPTTPPRQPMPATGS